MRIFVCHASEDKDAIARPLSQALRDHGHEVWFDEYSLRLGDSLSGEIDKGLAQCDVGVVVLSPSFFEKRWPRRELAGLVAREAAGDVETTRILPIWHNIGAEEVSLHSPTLADRVAAMSSEGIDSLVAEIERVELYASSATSRESSESPPRGRDPRELLHKAQLGVEAYRPGVDQDSFLKQLEDLVHRWETDGKLFLLAKVAKMSREVRKAILYDERSVFLMPTVAMGQVRIEVVDQGYDSIGLLWTPPGPSDNEYHSAVEYFLTNMGLLRDWSVEAAITPIMNSDDSFWVSVSYVA